MGYNGRVLAVLFLAAAIVLPGGCGTRSEDASEAKPVSPARSGLIHLTPEELARASIDATPVARGAYRVSREFPGTVQANQNELADVTTLIRGRVVTVRVDVGADVKKGDLLARLHSAELGMAESAYLKAAARLHEAELAYRRAKDLFENKAISQAEYLRREAEMRTAMAEFRETRNRLDLLGVPRHEIERLDRDGTIKSDVPLLAPFDGRVIMRNITRGEVVETDQQLFIVADLTHVWIIAAVPEKDVEYIQAGQTVDIIAAAYPHALFSGTVTYIGDMLDPATRTLRVRITAPNPGKRLKPEMFALVRVYAGAAPDQLTVPLAAVQSGPAGPIVFVRRSDREFEIRSVRLGSEYGDVVVVLGGLQAGEPVVTKGAFMLRSEMERHKIEPAP